MSEVVLPHDQLWLPDPVGALRDSAERVKRWWWKAREVEVTQAVALDQKLGTAQPTGVATTIVLSPPSSPVVAAGSRIVAWATNFGAETPASCASSPSLTWIRDLLVDDANGTTGAVFSADAPSGWTPGTITATYSASASVRGIAVASFSGIVGGSSGYLNGTPGFTNEFGTADWVTPNITTTGDALLFAALYADGAGGATATVTTSGAVELEDVFDSSGTTAEILTAYKVVSANGTYSIGGAFPVTVPGEQKYAIVGYQGVTVPFYPTKNRQKPMRVRSLHA